MNFSTVDASDSVIGEKDSVPFSLLCPLSPLLVSSLPCPRPEGPAPLAVFLDMQGNFSPIEKGDFKQGISALSL